MSSFFKITIISFFIFIFSWLVVDRLGINELSIQSEDIVPTIITPVAIIKDHTLYLDNYYNMMLEKYPHPDDKKQLRGLTPFYLQKVKKQVTNLWHSEKGEEFVHISEVHYLSSFPILTAIFALPVYFLPVKLGMDITFENLALLNHITSALIISLSGGVLYFLLEKHFDLSEKKSFLLVSVYLFGTINYAMFSQGLWQHGTVELLTILALGFLFEKKWFLMSFMLGLGVLARPTFALLVPFFIMLFIFTVVRAEGDEELLVFGGLKRLFNTGGIRRILSMLSGFIFPILFFIYYTKKYYLNLNNNGYSAQLLSGWKSSFPEGFLGMWFSPSKGVLVYSPILVFSCISLYLIIKNKGIFKNKNFKYIMFWSIITLHTLILSIWKHWYGGYGFGYRMAGDIVPFMVLTMVPYMKSDFFNKTKRLFFVLLGISVLMQVQGIVFFDSIWHAAYDDGFEDTKWLWSIKDSETIFNVRRVLVKLGFLERACPKCL